MTKLAFARRPIKAAAVVFAAVAFVACGSPTATANGALVTSVIAVVVGGTQAIFAWRQAGIQDAQRYAAVWPRISFDVSTNVVAGLAEYGGSDAGPPHDADGGVTPGTLRFGIINKGVGPALVRAFRAKLDGQPVRSADALIRKVYGGPRTHAMSSILGEVLAPSERVDLTAMVGNPDDIRPLRDALLTPPGGTPRLIAEICYCSVFEQCWWAVTDQEPTPTSSCPHDGASRMDTW